MKFSCDIFTILDCNERRARGALIGFRPGRSFYFRVRMLKRAEIRGIRKLESSAV